MEAEKKQQKEREEKEREARRKVRPACKTCPCCLIRQTLQHNPHHGRALHTSVC